MLCHILVYHTPLPGTLADIPVVVPPPHHVLVVGRWGDLKPLDILTGAKKEGVVSGCVV